MRTALIILLAVAVITTATIALYVYCPGIFPMAQLFGASSGYPVARVVERGEQEATLAAPALDSSPAPTELPTPTVAAQPAAGPAPAPTAAREDNASDEVSRAALIAFKVADLDMAIDSAKRASPPVGVREMESERSRLFSMLEDFLKSPLPAKPSS